MDAVKALDELVGVAQECLDLLGHHDGDPKELPHLIRDRMFAGAFYVPNGEYPRRGAKSEKPIERHKGGGRLHVPKLPGSA